MQRDRFLLSILPLLTAAAASWTLGLEAQPQKAVTLYVDAGFRGVSETFHGDVPNMKRTRLGNDRASSVRVAPGCTVVLYAGGDFQGRSTSLTQDLSSLQGTEVGNDTVSSLRLRCGSSAGGDADWSGRRGVALYRDAGFAGRREVFYGDDSDLRNNRIGAGAASSARVAPGCRATLYSETGYRGRSAEIDYDVRDLGATRLGNDAAWSLQVRCGDRRDDPWSDRRDDRRDRDPDDGWNPWGTGSRDRPGAGAGATLYAGGDYSGRSQTFTSDARHLAETQVGNDTVSSVRVAPGCRLTLFEHPDFRGQSTVLTGDEPDMRRSPLGNDSASSLRLDCSRSGHGSDPWDTGDGGGATLYAGGDYSGRSQTFTRDARHLAETQVGNDTVSSVRVSPGCRLTLFEHPDFQGQSTVLTGDEPDMRRTSLGNDRASSLRLDCDRSGHGSDPWDAGAGGGATLYAGGDYSGRSQTFTRDARHLAETEVGNDTVSSVRVDPGCRLMLFEHPRYQGRTSELTGDEPDMRRTSLGNDRASSLRLDCSRRGQGGYDDRWRDRGVTLYRDADFRGRSETLTRDVRNLGETAVGNDAVSSVRVDSGCRAVLYRHSDYRGESVVLTRDAESLRFTAVGNDAASSIEVDCR